MAASDSIHVFDIGARYGLHPSWKNCNVQAKYLMVDADPEECKRLRKRYGHVEGTVYIDNSVISSSSGHTTINILANPAMSTVFSREENTPLFEMESERGDQTRIASTIEVMNKSLDHLVDEYFDPDFIKIDIEGGELDALSSLGNYENVIGVRSEVNFVKNFSSETGSSFPKIHCFLEERGFILLNLDYQGKGDYWSELVSETGRYGTINTCDGVWVKCPRKVAEGANERVSLKLVIFLFLNNAPDVAIWLLGKLSEKEKLDDSTALRREASLLLIKHLYALKWSPSQSIALHKKKFESIFNLAYPEMNSYNESTTLNPVEFPSKTIK